MSLRALIVDDEQQARRRLHRLLGALPGVEVVGEAHDGAGLGAALEAAAPVDLMLLDVRMPGLSGVEARDLLGAGAPETVYVTAHEEGAVRAFAQGAADYLLKPVQPERLAAAVERVRERLERRRPVARAEAVALERAGDLLLLPRASIFHASVEGPLVRVGTAEGEVLTDRSLARLEAELDDPSFVRVHRRALVNLDAVRRLEPNGHGGMWAHTSDGARLPVSRQAARALRRRFGLG